LTFLIDKRAALGHPRAMTKPAEPFATRVVRLRLPKAAREHVLGMCRHSKDVWNTTVWLIRAAEDAYLWNPERKLLVRQPDADLEPDQPRAFAGWAAAIDALNAARLAKPKKTGKDGKPVAPKLLPPLAGEMASSELWRSLLDPTLLPQVVASWPDAQAPGGLPAYRTLPATAAEATALRVADGHWAWLGGLSARKAAGSEGARPGMPGFLPKHGSTVCEIKWSAIHGHPPRAKGAPQLWTDYARAKPVSPASTQAWESLDLRALADVAIHGRWPRDDNGILRDGSGRRAPTAEDGGVLRLVPRGRGVVMELTVRVPMPLPEGSFLAELARREPARWAECEKDGQKLDAWVAELAASQSWQRGKGAVRCAKTERAWVSQLFHAAGLDLGRRQIATLAYSSGRRQDVFMGHDVHAGLGDRDRRIDAAVARLMTPEQRTLAAERSALAEAGEKLPLNKIIRLRELSRHLHATPQLLRLRQERACFLDDAIHKLATAIADRAAEAGLAIIVVGRNKGWKQGKQMSRSERRAFGRIPHARLIEMLRWKLRERGIALLCVDEAFTSLSSFVDNDPLPEWGWWEKSDEPRAAAEPDSDQEAAPDGEASAAPEGATGEKQPAPKPAKPKARKAKAGGVRLPSVKGSAKPKTAPTAPEAGAPTAERRDDQAALERLLGFVRGEADKKAIIEQARRRDAGEATGEDEAPEALAESAAAAERNIQWSAKRDGGSRHKLLRRKPWPSPRKSGSPSPPKWVHADGNGACNILRRASPAFRWREGISAKHTLWRIGPDGVRPRDSLKAKEQAQQTQ
jgi:IS605 OrfB family transposase